MHEQNPAVGSAEDSDRSGTASADERRGGAAVMGCLERRAVIESVAAVEFSAQRSDGGDFDGFVVVQRRQDSGQALGQQCLARPGWSPHVYFTGGPLQS